MSTRSGKRGKPTELSGRRSILAGILAFVGFLIITSTFALLTPLSASPDEPDHWRQAYGVWSAQASLLGGSSPEDGLYEVPEYMSGYLARCTYQQSTVAADCIPEVAGDNLVEDFSSANQYPPAFYASVGWVTKLLSGESALYGLRLTSATLFSALAAMALALLLQTNAGWRAPMAVLLGLTPSIYFLAGTFNPTAIEVAAIALMSVIGWRWFRVPREVASHRWWFAALVVVGAYASLLRPLSVFMVLVSLAGLAVAAVPRRTWRVFAWKLGALGCGLVAFLAFTAIHAGTAGPFAQGDSGASPIALYAFRTTLWKGISSPSEWVGQMGWLDTGSNSISLAGWAAAIGMVLLPILTKMRPRYVAGILVVLGCLTVMWLLLDNYLSRVGGIPFWQARYAAPLVLVALLLVALSASGRPAKPRITATLARAAALMSLATLVAAAVMVVRFGWGPSWDGPWYPARWLPFGDNGKLTLLALLIIALGVVLASLGPTLALQLDQRRTNKDSDDVASEPAVAGHVDTGPPARRTGAT